MQIPFYKRRVDLQHWAQSRDYFGKCVKIEVVVDHAHKYRSEA